MTFFGRRADVAWRAVKYEVKKAVIFEYSSVSVLELLKYHISLLNILIYSEDVCAAAHSLRVVLCHLYELVIILKQQNKQSWQQSKAYQIKEKNFQCAMTYTHFLFAVKDSTQISRSLLSMITCIYSCVPFFYAFVLGVERVFRQRKVMMWHSVIGTKTPNRYL